MIQHPQLILRHVIRRTFPVVDHVLQPVVPVRNLLRDPVRVLVHAAVPVRPEAQQLAIERVFLLAVPHQHPHVDDPPPDRIRAAQRIQPGRSLHVQQLRRRLHKLHFVPFRILHVEPRAPVAALLHLIRNRHALRLQICSHLFGVLRHVRQMIQPACPRIGG